MPDLRHRIWCITSHWGVQYILREPKLIYTKEISKAKIGIIYTLGEFLRATSNNTLLATTEATIDSTLNGFMVISPGKSVS